MGPWESLRGRVAQSWLSGGLELSTRNLEKDDRTASECVPCVWKTNLSSTNIWTCDDMGLYHSPQLVVARFFDRSPWLTARVYNIKPFGLFVEAGSASCQS